MLLKTIVSVNFFLLFSLLGFSKELLPEAFQLSNIDEKLGDKISHDVSLFNSSGKVVPLLSLLNEKPIILNLVYYSCPQLCHILSDGLVRGINGMNKKDLTKFKVITISFDDRDNGNSTIDFKNKYVKKVTQDRNFLNWEFYYADKMNIKKLTESIGFNFYYNTSSKEYAHGSALFILSPDGTISRYLYGIMFDPFDLKMSIIEAAKNKTISAMESALLFCYNYDPNEKGYVLEAMALMKIGGALTVILLSGFIYNLGRKSGRLS